MAATPFEETPAGKAAGYGWSLAVINSSPDLRRLFAKASKENWTADHFVAMVRGTPWFKKNSDTARQASILAKADPATWKARINSAARHVLTLGNEMGAGLSPKDVTRFSRDVVMFGFTDEQVKAAMVRYIKPRGGLYSGNAAAMQMQIKQTAGDYGMVVPGALMAGWIKGMATGVVTPEKVKNYYTNLSASKYPSLAARIHAGETVRQIAEPYVQSYAKTLELNPGTIKLQDPAIQSALASRDAKGQPATKSVWEFEQGLRKDPRYMKTQQAQDGAMAMGHTVLKDLGILN